ncbi:MAG: hypothetical protein ACR2QS_08270 [Woeseiaceae bacterium]
MLPARKNFIAGASLIALLLPALPVVADESEDEDFNKLSVSLGVFFTDRESTSRLKGSVGNPGTPVDLEGDLGLRRNDIVFRIDGYYRFNDRHRIDASVFDLSRDKTYVIDEEIEWGDTIYPIDAEVKAEFDVAIYKLAYTWSFMRREKGYLGLSGGLYIASFGASLREAQLGSAESDTVTAPLPVFGLRGEYELSEKWTFRASSEIFAIEYEEYDGRLVDTYIGVDYKLWDKAAIGLGINSVTLDIDVDRRSFDGNFDWRYDGGYLFMKFDFL